GAGHDHRVLGPGAGAYRNCALVRECVPAGLGVPVFRLLSADRRGGLAAGVRVRDPGGQRLCSAEVADRLAKRLDSGGGAGLRQYPGAFVAAPPITQMNYMSYMRYMVTKRAKSPRSCNS